MCVQGGLVLTREQAGAGDSSHVTDSANFRSLCLCVTKGTGPPSFPAQDTIQPFKGFSAQHGQGTRDAGAQGCPGEAS